MVRKAYVDKNICIGCNVCSTECPEVFVVKEDPEHDNSFKSFTNDKAEQEPIAEKIQTAIDMCPVQCISWKQKQPVEQK